MFYSLYSKKFFYQICHDNQTSIVTTMIFTMIQFMSLARRMLEAKQYYFLCITFSLRRYGFSCMKTTVKQYHLSLLTCIFQMRQSFSLKKKNKEKEKMRILYICVKKLGRVEVPLTHQLSIFFTIHPRYSLLYYKVVHLTFPPHVLRTTMKDVTSQVQNKRK